jgi:hypothetical protein
MGVLLLLYAGFYLQLTYQHLLALLALLLITGLANPLAARSRANTSERAGLETLSES